MSPETNRDRKRVHRYTFVIVPDEKAEKTRTFSLSRWGFASIAIIGICALIAIVLAFVVYTPLGERLPISHRKVEERYAKQFAEIQRQIRVLVQGVATLRSYNLRLRKAMGEGMAADDSAMEQLISTQGKLALTEDSTLRSLPKEDVRPTAVSGSVGEDRSNVAPITTVSDRGEGLAASKTEFPLAMPVDGYVTRGFDPAGEHYGIDLAGKEGSPVTAAEAGNIVFSGWTYSDGFTMIIAHTGGLVSVYKHNESLFRHAGEFVKRGDVVALLGNTGITSSGPHLHFEVWKNGIVQDPNNYFLTTQ